MLTKEASLYPCPERCFLRQHDRVYFQCLNGIKLSAKGNLTKGLIVNKWTEIWEMDLDRAFTTDFEVFGAKSQNPTDAEIDFLIAIK